MESWVRHSGVTEWEMNCRREIAEIELRTAQTRKEAANIELQAAQLRR